LPVTLAVLVTKKLIDGPDGAVGESSSPHPPVARSSVRIR